MEPLMNFEVDVYTHAAPNGAVTIWTWAYLSLVNNNSFTTT